MEYNDEGRDNNDPDGLGNEEEDDEENEIARYTRRDESDYKYYYERHENGSEDEEDKDEDIEYHSDLKPARSMESMMAKQTIDNVLGNIFASSK